MGDDANADAKKLECTGGSRYGSDKHPLIWLLPGAAAV